MHCFFKKQCIFVYIYLNIWCKICIEVNYMEPIKVNELPMTYNIDKDLLRLISEANEKYGEYKSYLKNLEFDSKFFLDSVLLSESLKSTQIEGTQISQDDIYYFGSL